jgi:hypothetical protein
LRLFYEQRTEKITSPKKTKSKREAVIKAILFSEWDLNVKFQPCCPFRFGGFVVGAQKVGRGHHQKLNFGFFSFLILSNASKNFSCLQTRLRQTFEAKFTPNSTNVLKLAI